MSALANVAAARTFAPAGVTARPRAPAADVAPLHGEPARPSRIGGAPLSGARATSAYQRTAAVESLTLLSRVDEYV